MARLEDQDRESLQVQGNQEKSACSATCGNEVDNDAASRKWRNEGSIAAVVSIAQVDAIIW